MYSKNHASHPVRGALSAITFQPRVSHKTLQPGLISMQPSGLAMPEACKYPGERFNARTAPRRWCEDAIHCLVVLMITLACTVDLTAQGKTNLERGYAFKGFWQIASNGRDFNQATDCGPAQGGGGRCSIPLPQLKPLFRPRMLKWMETYGIHDEGLGGAYECAATPFPSSLEDPFILRVASENEIHIEGAWDNDYVRSVYLDGRKPSDGLNRLSYQGESLGHFEGDDLVVVSTNFTFDPDGLDDHLHLPSSPRKKVTVRYHLTAPDKLTMTITYEDSLFLKAPFTWSLRMQHSDPSKVAVFGLPFEPAPCSLEAAHAEIDLFDDK